MMLFQREVTDNTFDAKTIQATATLDCLNLKINCFGLKNLRHNTFNEQPVNWAIGLSSWPDMMSVQFGCYLAQSAHVAVAQFVISGGFRSNFGL